MIPLLSSSDRRGMEWRLALDDNAEPTIVFQRLEGTPGSTTWGHIRTVTNDPATVGVTRHNNGILILNEKMCRRVLEDEMRRHGSEPGIFTILDFAHQLEAGCHSPEAQPAVAARKLREAFYLLQDMARAINALGELVSFAKLSPEQLRNLKTHLSTIDQRQLAFPVMSLLTPAPVPKQPARSRPISRLQALSIARAAIEIHKDEHPSAKWPSEWIITAIVEASMYSEPSLAEGERE